MATPGKGDDAAFHAAYREGMRAFQAKQFDAAVAAFAKAISLNKTDTCSWEMFGSSLGNAGRYEDSLRAFDKVRDLGHECSSCGTNRVIALLEMRRPDEAREALRRVLELDPNSVMNWYRLGLVLGMSYASPEAIPNEPFDGRHEQAIEAFDRALALSPDHPGVLYYVGYVLYKLSHSTLARGRAMEAKGPVRTFWERPVPV